MKFYHASRDDTRVPVEPAVPIRDGGTPAQGIAAAPEAPAYLRPYANAARNSRVSLRLPPNVLKVRWQSELIPQFAPEFVLASGDRIVVAGADSWRVLDDSGATVGEDRRAPGDIVIDSAAGVFYFADTIGRVAAHQLKDAAKAFSLSVFFDDQYRRDFIVRVASRIIVLSIELQTDPHGESKPNQSVIELQEFSAPLEFSETRRLKSARRVNYLKRDTTRLLAALQGESLVLATNNAIYLAGTDLTLRAELSAEFEPRAFSLDEQSWIFLIAKVAGSAELWVLNDRGERVARTALPEGFEPLAPPIVGYDRTVYVISDRRVMAVAPDGKTLWDRVLDRSVSGAVVTADHRLLVTSGSELLSFDASGASTTLFSAPDDRLTTPPAPTPSGDVIIAGERRVYCLTSR